MKFLVDAQLPLALARALCDFGYEALHVEQIGLLAADDSAIWNHALQISAAIITKDEDFVIRLAHDSSGPFIVWLRIGNCSNTKLWIWLAPLLPAIEYAAVSGESMIEVI